jgi:protein-S-isoprenylcysteine O-methyltransferase Ste14
MSIPLFTLLAWLVWLIFYWNGGVKILVDIRAAQDGHDRLVLIALSVMTAALVIAVFAAYLNGNVTANGMIAANGLMFVLLGVGGMFFSRWTLGRYWTAQNTVQKDHRVVTEGLYRVVRHPIYTAALLLYLGTALVFFSPLISALTCAISAAYVYKTYREDKYLCACLPGYTQYTRRVSFRLVPLVW